MKPIQTSAATGNVLRRQLTDPKASEHRASPPRAEPRRAEGGGRAPKPRRRRTWAAAFGLAGLALVWMALGSYFDAGEARHREFLQAGQSINAFLKDYCAAFQEAHAGRDVGTLAALYADAYHPLDRGVRTWVQRGPDQKAESGLEIRRAVLEPVVGAPPPSLQERLETRLGEFQELEKATCKIDLIEQLEIGKRAVLTVKLIFDGFDEAGHAAQNLVFERWRLRASRSTPGSWDIVGSELVDGVRSAGERSALQKLDLAAAGIDFRHRRDPSLDRQRYREQLAFGVIQHASGGVSAADFDGDSRPDLLFLDGVRSRLYRNLGTEEGLPRFEDVTEQAGLGTIDGAHSGLFADFDEDGDRDLFIGRYLKRNLYFENQGDGRFEEAGERVGLGRTLPSAAATALDFDRDGDLDLYLAVYGNAFEELPRLPFFARNGEANRLWRNDGGFFVDVTEAAGVGDTGWSLAVAAHDVDGDGWSDLAVASDFGRKNLYRNNTDGTFTEIAKEAGVLDFGFGMGLAFADSDGDGDGDLFTSNVNSNQRWFGEDITIRQYLRNFARTRWILTDAGELTGLYGLLGQDWSTLFLQVGAGSSYFHNRGDGSFEEQPDGYTNRAGWGWGVAFFDLENDSDLDLYAANGWISDTPGTDL